MKEKTIALLGQPNAGKSTLFNGLTGSKQHVGNWPGKTVERKEGFFTHNGISYRIVDLPGTYSLSANSEEEIVTRDYIASGEADLVCILADSSQLERSLFMLADYVGIRVPVILLLNMMDVAASQGKTIDAAGIGKSLGIPVIPMVAADKKQYDSFFKVLESADKTKKVLQEKTLHSLYEEKINVPYITVLNLLPKEGIEIYSAGWLAAKLLENDPMVQSIIQGRIPQSDFQELKTFLSNVKDGNLLTGDCKFQWIDQVLKGNVTAEKNIRTRSRFDQAATSKKWGKPIAIGMIMAGLILSLVIGSPLMTLFDYVIKGISVPLSGWLLGLGVSPFLVSLLCGAVLNGVTVALQMASFVFGISLVFGFMEEVGYMARISYVFDNTMSKIGLQGKAIMPFIVSFGCNIGGMTGTRVIDSWGQRVMTMALAWAVPCASTWGVVGLVSGTFFGSGSVVVILALFAAVFLHIFITYKVFGRSLNKESERTGLIMELPPYHKPHWKNLFSTVFGKMGNVLKRALVIIIGISIVFWLLSYTPDGNVENSTIFRIGTFIEPVTMWFGLRWQMFMAFIASAMGKESSLGVMAALFNTSGIWGAIDGTSAVNTATLGSSLIASISKPEALAFLFAYFFNMPCLSTLAATAQESHSMKWTLKIAAYYIVVALIMSMIAYHIGMLIF
ncbi:MAG: ferrous iron transport protein B [Lachnospiraceae bacterium]|nr:ferrous iron transport protein B [Lachnospiraceae bacterium]